VFVQARLREIECLLLVIVCVSVLQDCIHVKLTIHCIAHTTARSINRTVARTMVTLRNEAEFASARTAVE
jgi:predicted transcriptional regulator